MRTKRRRWTFSASAGSGRPRKEGAVSHRPREALKVRTPVHAVVRCGRDVRGLRRWKVARVLARAFRAGCARDGFRIVQFSVQGNHIHLVIEADSAHALSDGMRAWTIRVARAINRVVGRKGKVFPERYHAVRLRTARQVRAALCYVLQNARKHGLDVPAGSPDVFSSAWWFDGWKDNEWREGFLDEGFTSFQTELFTQVATGRTSVPGLDWEMLLSDLDGWSEPTSLVSERYRDSRTYSSMIYDRGELFFHRHHRFGGKDFREQLGQVIHQIRQMENAEQSRQENEERKKCKQEIIREGGRVGETVVLLRLGDDPAAELLDAEPSQRECFLEIFGHRHDSLEPVSNASDMPLGTTCLSPKGHGLMSRLRDKATS